MNRRSALVFSDGAAGRLLKLAEDLAGSDLSWMDHGACSQFDGDSWFVAKGQPTTPAKNVCRSCPVQQICLEYALENDIRYGVWGMASEYDRRKIRSKRLRESRAAA